MTNELDKIIDYIIGDIKDETSYINSINEKPFSVITVYFMWLLKKNPSITLETLESEGFYKEWAHIAYFSFHDVENYFSDHKKAWERLVKISDEYSEETLKNIILQESENDEKLESIVDLVIRFMDVKKGEKVLEIFDDTEYFITECKKRNPSASVLNYEDVFMVANVNAMRLNVQDYSNIEMYTDPYEERDIDKIFVNTLIRNTKFVFDYIVKETFPDFPYGISCSWDICGYALSLLKENGRAFVLMNGGDLTVKQNKDIREYMCDNGYIEGIIKLPEKMIGDVRTNLYLLIMSFGNSFVKFYDAKDMYISDRVNGKKINRFSDTNISEISRSYNEKAKKIMIECISRNQYNLNTTRYLLNSQENTIELGNMIYEINRGITLSAKKADEIISDDISDIKCIMPSSIMNGVVQTVSYYHGDIKSFKKNYAESGDILITKTGNPFRVAIARERYLVIGNIYILKYNSTEIPVEYIKCFLDSKKGQNEMERFASGPLTPIISISNINRIQIPVYENKLQKERILVSKKIISNLEECYRQISNSRQEINDMFN